MRISELAKEAGVPLSAVKYYQREGLIPEGEKLGPNQTSYDESHVQRVRLIRALLGIGGLSVAQAKEIIAAMNAGDPAETFEAAQHAMLRTESGTAAPSEDARRRVLDLAARQNWTVTANNPGVDEAARAIDGFSGVGFDVSDSYLEQYARAAEAAARADLHELSELDDSQRQVEIMVVGSVLGTPLFTGLRHIAQQDATQYNFARGRDQQSQE